MHWISFKNKPEDYNDKMGEGWHMFTICVSYVHNCHFNECVYSFVISDFNPVARYVDYQNIMLIMILCFNIKKKSQLK